METTYKKTCFKVTSFLLKPPHQNNVINLEIRFTCICDNSQFVTYKV